MPFLAGFIYPLVDADRFDDDFGEGYDHIMIPHDASPGDCYIHDAWIVNAEGKVHPGYEANPHPRSEEHTSELQSLMRISYAVFCLKKKTQHKINNKLNRQIQ